MNPPKTILVATDFSEPSDAALAYAATLGQKLGAALHLVNSFELPIAFFPDGVLVVTAEAASRITDAAQTRLREAVDAYAKRGIAVTSHLVQGDAREGILSVASKVGADLIVMGTHGRRGLSRALIGSITESVLRTSNVPVLTVHAPPKSEG